jgi:hypothetical protein
MSLGCRLQYCCETYWVKLYIYLHVHPLPKGRLIDHTHHPLKSTKVTICIVQAPKNLPHFLETFCLQEHKKHWTELIVTAPTDLHELNIVAVHFHSLSSFSTNLHPEVINTQRLPSAKACQSGV